VRVLTTTMPTTYCRRRGRAHRIRRRACVVATPVIVRVISETCAEREREREREREKGKNRDEREEDRAQTPSTTKQTTNKQSPNRQSNEQQTYSIAFSITHLATSQHCIGTGSRWRRRSEIADRYGRRRCRYTNFAKCSMFFLSVLVYNHVESKQVYRHATYSSSSVTSSAGSSNVNSSAPAIC
jgi:hypothetical protein